MVKVPSRGAAKRQQAEQRGGDDDDSPSLAPLAERIAAGESVVIAPSSRSAAADDAEFFTRYIVAPTGQTYDRQSVDDLIDGFEAWDRRAKEAYAVAMELRRSIAEHATRDPALTAKTRRVQGERRRAKVEMPDDAWDQPLLKKAWESFPEEIRDQALKIATIGVKVREWKKLRETTGDGTIIEFRDLLERANRGQVGTPTVSIEV